MLERAPSPRDNRHRPFLSRVSLVMSEAELDEAIRAQIEDAGTNKSVIEGCAI